MKRWFRYVFAGLLLIAGLNGLRAQAVHLSIGSDSVCGADSVFIPVTADNFTNLSAFTIHFDLDSSILAFDTISNIHPQLLGVGSPFSVIGSGVPLAGGEVSVSWLDLISRSISNGDTLFILNCVISSGSTAIDIDPGSTEVFNEFGTPVAFTSSSGMAYIVNPPPMFGMLRDEIICLGDSAYFDIISPATSFQWQYRTASGSWLNVPASISSGAQSGFMSISPTTPATYLVRCIVSDYCADTSAAATLTVNTTPGISITPDTTILAGQKIQINASGGTSYSWSHGAITPTDSVAPLSTTTYIVTVSNANGCSAVDSVIVTVDPLPPAELYLGDITGCADTVLVPVIGIGLDSVGAFSFQISYDETLVNIPNFPGFIVNSTIPTGVLLGSVSGGIINFQWFNSLQTQDFLSDTIFYIPVIGSNTASALQWVDSLVEVSPDGYALQPLTLFDGNVVIDSLPDPPQSIPDTVCQGQTANLTANAAGNIQWYSLPGYTLLGSGASYAPSPASPGNYYYAVTQTDGNGCESRFDTVNLLVNAGPNADAGLPDTIPFGGTTQLNGSVTSGTPPYTYSWSPANLLQNSSIANPQTNALNNTTWFELQITDSAGCIDIDSVQVVTTGGPLSIDSIIVTPGTACPGDSMSLSLTVSGGNPPFTYQWAPAGLFNNPTLNQPHIAANQSQWVYVTVSDTSQFIEDSVFIRINTLPEDFEMGEDAELCPGEPGVPVFLEESTDSIRYELYYNGSLIQSEMGINDSLGFGLFADTGNYRVYAVDTLTGCSVWLSDTIEIELLEAPTAVIVPSADTGICLGETISYNDSLPQQGGWTYEWFRNPGFSLGTGYQYSNSPTAGTHEYYLVVTNDHGCSDTSDIVHLEVNELPIAHITAPAELCENSSILVSSLSSSGTGVLTQQWSGPASSYLSTLFSQTPVFQGAPSGSHDLILTISDSLGCMDDDTVSILVNPTPQLNAGPTITVSYGSIVNLVSNASPSANLAYTWTPGALLDDPGIPDPQTVPMTNTTQFFVYVFDTNTICSAADSFVVTVQGGPIQIDTILLSSSPICPNDTATITAVVSGGSGQYSYTWSSGTIPVTDSVVQLVAPPSGGAIFYSITVTDTITGDTEVRNNRIVPVHPQPEIEFPFQSLCMGDSIVLNGSLSSPTTGPYTYTWSGPNNSSSVGNPWIIPNATSSMFGFYTVELIDGNGCRDTYTNNVIVRDTPYIILTALDSLICPNQQTLVYANVSNGTPSNYIWSDPSLSGWNPVIQPTDTTTYIVTVTLNGCTASAGITINTLPGVNSYIDTSFCAGDSILINGQWYSQAGFYTDSSITAAGCDSIITINISIDPLPNQVMSGTPDTSLIACYDLAGSATDGSINGHDGILNGPVAATNRFGQPAKALEFDGVNDDVEIAHHPDFDFGSNDFTLLAWIYPTAFDGNMGLNAIITKHTGDPGSWLFRVASDPMSAGDYKLNFETNSPVMRYYGNTTVSLNTWQMAAITRSGNNYTFYYNGIADGSFTDTKSFTTTQPVRLSGQGNVTDERFSGSIDDVRIYNKALSPQEIQEAFNAIYACNTLDSNLLQIELADDSICEYEDGLIRLINSQAGVEYQLYDTANSFSSVQFGNNDTLFFPIPAAINDQAFEILATDTTTGCSRILDTLIEFTVLPTPVAVITGDSNVCQGGSVTLTASGGNTYTWNTVPAATTASVSVSPNVASTYTVTVSQDGCVDSSSFTVNITPSVYTNIYDTICEGDTAWHNSQAYTSTGIYEDTLVASVGCDSIVTINITVNPLPWAILPPIPSVMNCTDDLVDPRDGKTYATTLIGKQCWMAANLDYGNFVSSSTPMSNNSTPEKYCYSNNASNCGSYGALYQWNELMQYTTSAGSQGLCPPDWHVPTDAEWITLEGNVDNTYGPGNIVWNGLGWRGDDAGFELKSASGWPPANPAPTNSFGFTSLPSGYRNAIGNFNNFFNSAYYWTSNGSAPTSSAFQRIINTNNPGVYRSQENMSSALAVRCVKDTLINPPGAIQIDHPDSICEYESAEIHILSSQHGVSYLIYDTNSPSAYSNTGFGNGDTLTFTIPPYTPASALQILATDTTTLCERLLDTLIEITVIPAPAIIITNDTSLCNGDSITLTASGGQNYIWNTIPPTSTPGITVSPMMNTTYSVTVSNLGCEDSARVTVDVLPVFYDTINETICEGDTFIFLGQSYHNQGLYNDTLTSIIGCDSIITLDLHVDSLPWGVNTSNAVGIVHPDSVCEYESAEILLINSQTGISYLLVDTSLFQPIGAPQVGNGDTLVFTVPPPNQGGDLVFFAENPVTGCQRILDTNINITVIPSPVADITPGDTTICAGESVTLTASGGGTYQWTNGPTSASNTVSPPATTQYSVFVTQDGCSAMDSVLITVTPLPQTATSGDSAICIGDSLIISASGGSTYQWAPASSLDDPQVPDPMASPTISTQYFVTVTEQGCSALDSLTITVNPLPATSISNDTTICFGEQLEIIAGGGSSYLWSGGQINDTITVQPATTTLYIVTISTAFGCSGTEDILINVEPLPVANAGADQTINYGTSTTLNGSAGGSGGPYTYQWAPAASLTNTNAAQPNTTPLLTNTTFYLTVTDQSTGCVDLDTVTVFVTGNPVQIDSLVASPAGVCPGDSTDLSAAVSGGTGNYAFSWELMGSGIIGQDSMISVGPNNTSLYRCIVYDSISYDTAYITVNVFNNPTAQAFGGTTVCPRTVVQLTASGGVMYQWENLPPSTNPQVNWVANQAGYVSVTVTDANGCTDTDSVLISLHPDLQIQIIVSSNVCEGNMMVLLGDIVPGTGATAQNPVWTGPAGFLANVYDTIVQPAQLWMEGMYTFTLSNSYGCTASDSAYVNVFPAPQVNMSLVPSDFCENDTAVLITASPYPGGFFSGTGVQSNFNGTAWFDPALAGPGGPYSVTYTYADSNNCTVDTTSFVIVHPEPDAIFTGLQANYCENDPVDTLYGTPSNGGIFSGSGITNIAPGMALFDPSAAGSGNNINITYSYLDSQGCGDDTLMQTNVIANPVVTITADTSICFGDSAQLLVTGGTSYFWTPSAGLSSSTIANPIASPAATTTYFAEVSANGCSTIDSLTITIMPLPPADAGNDTSFCVGDSVLLTGSGGSTYEWSNGAMSQSTFVAPNIAQQYFLTVSDGSCEAIDSVLVTPIPLPIADAGIDTGICATDSIQLNASGGSSYAWGPGAGLSNSSIANPMASPGITTQYFVTVTDQGCTAIDSLLITVTPLPVISVSSDTVICAGDTAQISASGGSAYAWSPAANLQSPNSAISLAWPGVNTTYTVTVTENGCSDTDDVTVQVNPLPPADAGPDTSICDGDSVLLTASGGSSYLWSTGDNSSSIYVSPANTAEYIVTVSDALCSSTDTVMVNWKPIPVAEAGPDTAICLNDSVQLNGSGGNTYQWAPISGLSNSGIADPYASPASSGYYHLTVTTNGCSSADSVFVDVYPLPPADAGTDTSICQGDSAYLQASGGTQYTWSTTPPSNTASVAVGPLITTIYYVTVSDGLCEATDSVTVTVDPQPNIVLSQDTSICEGDSANLTVGGGSAYLWSTVPPSNQTSIWVSPSDTTWYYVTVTNGNCDATDSVEVAVVPLPLADAGADTSICFGDSTRLQGSGGQTYLWSPAGSLSSATVSNPFAFPASPQWYLLTVTSQGCSAQDSVFVDVTPLPVANAGNDTLICPGDTASLHGSGGVSYLWSPANLLDDPAVANPFATLTSDTTFYLTVTENGCEGTDSVRVEMHPLPVLQVDPPSADICMNESIILQASGGQNYLWSPAAGLNTTNAAAVIASPGGNTIYTVQGENAFGCIDSVDVEVNVHPRPDIVATLDDPVICRGEYVEIEASGAERYYWYPSSGLSSDTAAQVIASPVWTTTYFVIGFSEYGCGDTIEIEISVLDRINLDLGPDRFYCAGDELILEVGNDTSINYIEWQDGSGTPIYSVTEPGTYWVYADNGECPESDTLVLFPCTELWTANSFTPNGDGLNDYFEVKASTLLYQYHIWIFNRWGEVVFESLSIDQHWDGTVNGVDAPIGVYSYVIEYTGQADVAIYRSQRRVGSITLLR